MPQPNQKMDVDFDKLEVIYQVFDFGLTRHEIHCLVFHLLTTHENAQNEILEGIALTHQLATEAEQFEALLEMLHGGTRH